MARRILEGNGYAYRAYRSKTKTLNVSIVENELNNIVLEMGVALKTIAVNFPLE